MAIADLVGKVLGGSAGKDEMEQSLALSREAREELRKLYVPTVAEQEVSLLSPELAGLLAAEQLGDSQMAGVSADPRLKQAQMKALDELAGLSKTGLGADDQYAFNQLRRQAGAEAQAQQASILSNAAASGTLDSGNALMAQLNASQQQSNRLQQAGEAQAAQAAAARRAALGQYADMSSNMANTDFNQKSQTATARDAINRFNAQNRQDVNATNLANRQAILNQKAATGNQQQLHNKGLIQQNFQNQMAKTTGVANQTNNLAAQYGSQGQAAAQGQANMMSGLISAGAGIGAAAMKNKKSEE